MLCDTCTNRRYCENEERQMCIANDYDRYDDDGSFGQDYDTEIDTVKMVVDILVTDNIHPAINVMNSIVSTVSSLVDNELGNMMIKNILKTAGTCHA